MRAKYLGYGERKSPTEISEVLGTLIERAAGKIDVRQGEMIRSWSEFAPGDWPDQSVPIGIRDKTLLVEVANGTAGTLLKYQTEQLLYAIKGVFGDDLVTSIRLRVSR